MNSAPVLNRWRWPALATASALYAFVASWAVQRWPILTPQMGAIGILFAGLYPVTILTPAILVWVFQRPPARWMIWSLGLSLIACLVGAWVGNKGTQEVIFLIMFLNVPLLVVWTAIIAVLASWLRSKDAL
jgi:hypothetical protein